MNAAPKPIDKPAAPPGDASRKRWAPPPPPQKNNYTIILVLIAATLACIGLVIGLQILLKPPAVQAPLLAREFRDTVNHFSIQSPRHWSIDDRSQDGSVFIQGPKEARFRPLMWIVASLPAPGKLPKFVAEHKARLQIEEPTVKFTAEDTDSIDGCEAVRLEYECDFVEVPGATPFKLKTIQFILKDPTYYSFYKITCSSRAETFDKHKGSFEASARTFHRLPLPETKPRFLP